MFDAFSHDDAWELGHLLHARLSPIDRPTLISISLANGLIVFQATAGGANGAYGAGVQPDNETWVKRKRASVMRWGRSTWYLHCKFAGDEERFARTYGMSTGEAGKYAIHGGAVPERALGEEEVTALSTGYTAGKWVLEHVRPPLCCGLRAQWC